MSARSSIIDSLVTLVKTIDGSGSFKSNLYDNVKGTLVFWDEINDFPYVCMSAGSEQREYLPGGFKWGYLAISMKIYVQTDTYAIRDLENILEDIENLLDANNHLEYDADNSKNITDIRVTSIVTDEGLLAPDGVGELDIIVQYEVL